jgi:hypothetical protein
LRQLLPLSVEDHFTSNPPAGMGDAASGCMQLCCSCFQLICVCLVGNHRHVWQARALEHLLQHLLPLAQLAESLRTEAAANM